MLLFCARTSASLVSAIPSESLPQRLENTAVPALASRLHRRVFVRNVSPNDDDCAGLRPGSFHLVLACWGIQLPDPNTRRGDSRRPGLLLFLNGYRPVAWV